MFRSLSSITEPQVLTGGLCLRSLMQFLPRFLLLKLFLGLLIPMETMILPSKLA